jgi:thioesterase domain-containing protein
VLAYEIAQQLTLRGEEVERVLLLDAVLPPKGGKLRKAGRAAWNLSRRGGVQSLVARVKKRVLGASSAGSAGGYERVVTDDDEIRALDAARMEAFRESVVAYAPFIKKSKRPVTLVVAGERIEMDILADPKCGWQKLLSGLDVVTLPTSHMGLMKPPFVKDIAQAVIRKT